MIHLDRQYILDHVDAKLTEMGFCKKSGFYLLWRGNTVTTLWIELYGPRKTWVEYRIGKYGIWDGVDSWKFLKDGTIHFTVALYGKSFPESYYQILKTIGLDPVQLQNTRINMLYGEQASLSDYLQMLDEGLFPFLQFISIWSGYKLSCSLRIPESQMTPALYDRDIDHLKNLRQMQIEELSYHQNITPQKKEEILEWTYKRFDPFISLMEQGQWDKIDSYLAEQAAPMTALLTKKKIPNNGLVLGSYTKEQFEGIVQDISWRYKY